MIRDIEDGSAKNIQTEAQKGKGMENTYQTTDPKKCHVRYRSKKIQIKPQVQETPCKKSSKKIHVNSQIQETTRKIRSKKIISSHVKVKLLKIKHKENNLKPPRRKKIYMAFKGSSGNTNS